MEDKEECSSSRLVIKKLPPTASPVSAKEMTTPKGKVPEESVRKTIAALPGKESTLGQAKSKMAKAVLAQGQSSEQAAKGTTLDLATSKETVGGATTDLWASAAAPENFPNQTTSVEALGETEPTPPASHTNKQTTGASPLQGVTAQQSLQLGVLSTLELSREAEVKSTTSGKEVEGLRTGLSQIHLFLLCLQEAHDSEEGLLGEAAGGQDMNSLMLTQGFGDFNTQVNSGS
jgi:histone deacetylase 6